MSDADLRERLIRLRDSIAPGVRTTISLEERDTLTEAAEAVAELTEARKGETMAMGALEAAEAERDRLREALVKAGNYAGTASHIADAALADYEGSKDE